jgi:hypothetical protein
MIESVIILTGAGAMGLVLVVCMLARRAAPVPVAVRIRNK